MDKWKVVVILALVFGLGGYGWYSSNAVTPTAPVPAPGDTPEPTPAQPELVGKPLPTWDIASNFWVNTPKPITPADLKGSVTLIEFFRIGCSHCQEAAPFMEKIYETYQPRGLKMLAIQSPSTGDAQENDWLSVKGWVGQQKLKYPVTFDQGGKIFREKFGLKIFPSIIVVDKDGVIRYFKTGHTEATAQALTDYLESVLKKP